MGGSAGWNTTRCFASRQHLMGPCPGTSLAPAYSHLQSSAQEQVLAPFAHSVRRRTIRHPSALWRSFKLPLATAQPVKSCGHRPLSGSSRLRRRPPSLLHCRPPSPPPPPPTQPPPLPATQPASRRVMRPETLERICVSWNKGRCVFPGSCQSAMFVPPAVRVATVLRTAPKRRRAPSTRPEGGVDPVPRTGPPQKRLLKRKFQQGLPTETSDYM